MESIPKAKCGQNRLHMEIGEELHVRVWVKGEGRGTKGSDADSYAIVV
jgi:hypothetical protein